MKQFSLCLACLLIIFNTTCLVTSSEVSPLVTLPTCSSGATCPPGASCLDASRCFCRLGFTWTANLTFCEHRTCSTEWDCLPWPNAICSRRTHTCTCDQDHRLEADGLVCSITVDSLLKRIIGWELIFIGLLFVFGFGICSIRQQNNQKDKVTTVYGYLLQENAQEEEGEKVIDA